MTYTVQVIKTSNAVIEVDAESEDSAKELAINNADQFNETATKAFVVKMEEF